MSLYDNILMMEALRRDSHFFWVTLVSILGHLALCTVISLWFQFKGLNFLPSFSSPKKQIEVSQVNREFLQKLKTVGIKNGSKDFQMPVNSPSAIKLPSPATQRVNLSPEALAMNLSKEQLKNIGKSSKRVQESTADGISFKSSEKEREKMHRERELNSMLKREMLKQNIAPSDQGLIRNTDINMHFQPPEGVDESELNSMEKKFYSFRKRSYEAYINSFLSTYHSAVNQRPYLHQVFNSSNEYITGKVTFDLEGNLISIKIIQPAHNDEIQKIFEKTLENIKSLKNPPQEFVERENEFSVYYSLKINNQ